MAIDSLLARPNNFLVAASWLEREVPSGSSVLIESVDQSAQVPIRHRKDIAVTYRGFAPGLPLKRILSFDYIVTWQNGPHRVDRFRYGIPPFLPGGYAQVDARTGRTDWTDNWRAIIEQAQLVKEFDPFQLGTQGPKIQVWQPKRHSMTAHN